MEAHVKYENEKKKMVHYDRKGYKSWNKSTICFDKYLKYPPLKVNGRYEIFAPKEITIHRLKHQKIPFMFEIKLVSGIALVNLRERIKSKLEYFSHTLMISESVDNVTMEIFNNTNSDVIVKRGESLCFVNFI